MLEKTVKVWLLVVLLWFFTHYIGNFAYALWVIAGFTSILFPLFTYVWAKCEIVLALSLAFNAFLLFLVILKIYRYFKE